jgi:hypothetical protein
VNFAFETLCSSCKKNVLVVMLKYKNDTIHSLHILAFFEIQGLVIGLMLCAAIGSTGDLDHMTT